MDNVLYVTEPILLALEKARVVLGINIADVENELKDMKYKGNALKLVSTALEEQRNALAVITNLLVRFSPPDSYEVKNG